MSLISYLTIVFISMYKYLNHCKKTVPYNVKHKYTARWIEAKNRTINLLFSRFIGFKIEIYIHQCRHHYYL